MQKIETTLTTKIMPIIIMSNYTKKTPKINKIIEEIRERIHELHSLGISQLAIQQALILEPKPLRITITKNYKIIIDDYNEEIMLRPLAKAIYILFLKHPEGIVFKHLPDYREELSNIYMAISDREVLSKIKKAYMTLPIHQITL